MVTEKLRLNNEQSQRFLSLEHCDGHRDEHNMRALGLETCLVAEVCKEGGLRPGVLVDRYHPGHGLFLPHRRPLHHREAVWNKVKRNSLGIFRE